MRILIMVIATFAFANTGDTGAEAEGPVVDVIIEEVVFDHASVEVNLLDCYRAKAEYGEPLNVSCGAPAFDELTGDCTYTCTTFVPTEIR